MLGGGRDLAELIDVIKRLRAVNEELGRDVRVQIDLSGPKIRLGDFTVRAKAEEDTSRVGPVDLVMVAVKAYDNATALPMLPDTFTKRMETISTYQADESAGTRLSTFAPTSR